mmetsp:Transcript_9821/g.14645  ORF Transcript_9821/g.14645 Transcript_9821/m.14645 type:complete len:155 (-) Transcript_9821:1266-1730(-)
MKEAHWYIPGVKSETSVGLPKGPNLQRSQEHICGTTQRDPLCWAYPFIKGSSNPVHLKSYLVEHAHRVIFEKLEQKGLKNYYRLSTQERLDLALNYNLVSTSALTYLHQLKNEAFKPRLVVIFTRLLIEIQPNSTYFEPLVTNLLRDQEFFTNN